MLRCFLNSPEEDIKIMNVLFFKMLEPYLTPNDKFYFSVMSQNKNITEFTALY